MHEIATSLVFALLAKYHPFRWIASKNLENQFVYPPLVTSELCHAITVPVTCSLPCPTPASFKSDAFFKLLNDQVTFLNPKSSQTYLERQVIASNF
jgi:hypothetical protein